MSKKRIFPDRVHRKRGRSAWYYYFNTGRKDGRGKPILVSLPTYGTPAFWKAYSACLETISAAPEEPELTVPAFCEKFRRSPKFRRLAKGTQESYGTYLRVIEDQFDTFLAHEVEPRDVLALMEKMSSRPAAANQMCRTMSALYAWGSKPAVGLVGHNPAAGQELYEGGTHKAWPEWLLQRALNADDHRVRLAAHLLYYTAARVGDVAKLRWQNLEGERVCYTPEKTQRKKPDPLEFPIHSALGAMLATIPRGVHTTIICKPNGAPYAADTISDWMMDFAAEHGQPDLKTHGLRKNAVNAILECGCTIVQAQAITGQSLQVIELYARQRDKRKLGREAMALWDRNREGA